MIFVTTPIMSENRQHSVPRKLPSPIRMISVPQIRTIRCSTYRLSGKCARTICPTCNAPIPECRWISTQSRPPTMKGSMLFPVAFSLTDCPPAKILSTSLNSKVLGNRSLPAWMWCGTLSVLMFIRAKLIKIS